MKKKLALLAAPVVALAASSVMAQPTCWEFRPYVGADAQIRSMEFKRNFGDNIFKKTYPQGNVFVGLRFCDFLAVEVGYEATGHKKRTSTVEAGDVVLGTVVDPGDTIVFDSRSKIHGWHADLLGIIPFEEYCSEIYGSIGFASLKTNLQRNAISINGVVLTPADTTPANFGGTKTVLRLGAGVRYYVDCNWGIQGTVAYENTAKFHLTSVDTSSGVVREAKLKDSFNYGLGLFYVF